MQDSEPTETSCGDLDDCGDSNKHSDGEEKGDEDQREDGSDASAVMKTSIWLSAGLGLLFWLLL